MDVVSLAQFGIENAVATLGTATTRTHLQRLFRLAPEVVFCFDGDRAGRDAGWKAMQVALPELQDGRQLGFLFLPEGEDPDTIVRSEGAQAFRNRVSEAMPLDQFLFSTLVDQTDMTRIDGRARLVSLAQPLIQQLPEGSLRQMMLTKLSSLSGLSSDQFAQLPSKRLSFSRRQTGPNIEPGQLSPMAFAICLLLQTPQLEATMETPDLVGSSRYPGSRAFTQNA